MTIRGFDQTNLAVMVDGVPMNDMENGWVYWSNWAGLDLVVRTTQVQRGLGASKLAIPSVGGTINILTGGDESGNGRLTLLTEVGNYGYHRNSLSGVFGSQEKGFLHFVGSYRTNQGFAAGLESKSVFYVENGPRAVPGVSQSSEVCILRQVLKTPLCEVFVHFPIISQLLVAKPHQPWW